jgi:hypothetical protein
MAKDHEVLASSPGLNCRILLIAWDEIVPRSGTCSQRSEENDHAVFARPCGLN